MGDKSKIEWTDATWNPVTGCTRVSEGCRNCYIERTPAFRIHGRKFAHGTTGVQLHPARLEQPLKWKRPRRIFVNSLSDLFHEDVPEEFVAKVWDTMARTPWHTYQILTKRAERMNLTVPCNANRHTARDGSGWPLPNVWLGVSIENQQTADERIPLLLQTPAAIRFISYEPALGPVVMPEEWLMPAFSADDDRYHHPGGRGLDWVIAGGESGPGARPMHPDWVRSIRDQCQAAGVPFFFKQWGEWVPAVEAHGITGSVMQEGTGDRFRWIGWDGTTQNPSSHGLADPVMAIAKVGKKKAGSMLDGREHKEWPR